MSQIFCRPNAILVTQPTVSKHWRDYKAPTLTSDLASFSLSITRLPRDAVLFPIFWLSNTSTSILNKNCCCCYHFMDLCPGLTGWDGTRRNIHPLTYPDHHPTFISFFHLPWSIAPSLFNLCAWQSFCTTSLQVLFGLPLGLEPSTSYSIYFFTQSMSSFCNRCPYHHNLFCCSTKIISSILNLSLNSLPQTLSFALTSYIHLTILISARWSATSFSTKKCR